MRTRVTERQVTERLKALDLRKLGIIFKIPNLEGDIAYCQVFSPEFKL